MSEPPLIAFGDVDPASRRQIERCLDVAGAFSRGVLCADHHKGYSMPIGGVVASPAVIMPAGVGYDIGCGNCAVQTTLKAAEVDIERVMDEIWRTISFGMGLNNDERISEHPVFDAIDKSPVKQQRKLLMAARQAHGEADFARRGELAEVAARAERARHRAARRRRHGRQRHLRSVQGLAPRTGTKHPGTPAPMHPCTFLLSLSSLRKPA